MSAKNSIVISVPCTEDEVKNKNNISLFSLLKTKSGTYDPKQLIHSIKVAIALVFVSLFYLVDPLYDQVGENAMWAIMTVVVVFEFFAGATLSKGLNRGIGTVLGGLLGCLASTLVHEIGGICRAVATGTSVFIFGAAASYFRLVPSIKKKYDYGFMIFILTFNLVAVSGLRGEQVIVLARERLATIVMGFVISILTSLLIFPMWASDELHRATVNKFDNIASSIEGGFNLSYIDDLFYRSRTRPCLSLNHFTVGCLEEYLYKIDDKKESVTMINWDGYKSVLQSKSKDETLANFARWEPWHGKFGFYHPWEKYLNIGDLLRELAISISSLKDCLQSSQQPLKPIRLNFKEPCEAVAPFLACTLKELGESIMDMRRSRPGALIVANLQSIRLDFSEAVSDLGTIVDGDGLANASFVFLLMEMMSKIEMLAKEVEELGELAGFQA
ncbi:Aluminum-activated malate transporter [Thalictrum thalictroides]|uniref:Aluminum-activated malate transporter n=1 Tax=Thalictrum thalictroides TaxID=46969 RepID=A0A7J6V372_THATH|nr:Aluminum-activated malate transporter [Thalictrum thalictroides]